MARRYARAIIRRLLPALHGYEQAELVEVVYRKTLALIEAGAPMDATTDRIALGLGDHPATIVDLGGACGATYFRLRPLLTWPVRWIVVETPAMVAHAQPLADGRLSFSDRLPDGPDTVIASGVLQYLPDGLATLREIVGLRPRTIILTRTWLTEAAPLVMAQRSLLSQNGPGPLPPGFRERDVSYHAIALPRAVLLAELVAYDLTPLAEDDGPPVDGVAVCGWIARRR